jgi:cytochrome c oxidase subunit 2
MRRAFPLVACLALAACAGRQSPLNPTGDQAMFSDLVWRVMLVVCGVMYVLVMAFLAWALVRARTARAETEPAVGATAAEPAMERGLAGWSALIIAGLVGLSLVSFVADRGLAMIGPQPLHVKITGAQWWWQIEYTDGGPSERINSANELHLPVGRPVRLTLVANDVIHSFWVPNLSGKEDLIPGRTNVLALTPRRVGVFRGQCAEFCGLQHAHMALAVVVEEPAAFETWRRRQLSAAAAPATPAEATGQALFLQKGCAVCHRIAGTDAGGVTGPDLSHVAGRRTLAAGSLPNTRAAMISWIDDPQAHKPGATMPKIPLSAQERATLADYLETLR